LSFYRFSVSLLLLACLSLSGCTLGSPFNQLIPLAEGTPTEVALAERTPRATFTPTPDWTDTPTHTATPTLTHTPIPTDTPVPTDTPASTDTPVPTDTPAPTDTPVPTNTSAPVVQQPAAPTSPPPPTNTPEPSWDFHLAEMFSAPSLANIFSIMVAVQNHDNGWIAGYRVVGKDPNGLITKSEPSAEREVGHTPANSSVIKAGNTKFEPQPVAVYITGVWEFHLETADGRQVSDTFTINIDEENRAWFFFQFKPN